MERSSLEPKWQRVAHQPTLGLPFLHLFELIPIAMHWALTHPIVGVILANFYSAQQQILEFTHGICGEKRAGGPSL